MNAIQNNNEIETVHLDNFINEMAVFLDREQLDESHFSSVIREIKDLKKAAAELAQMQARLAAVEELEKKWRSEEEYDLDYIGVVRGCADELHAALNGEEWSVDEIFVTLPAPEQMWRITYQKRLYEQGYTKHDAHESAKAAEYDSEIDPIEAADDEVSYE